MAKQIYQVKISLSGFKPSIWRRILVPSNLKLSDFHKVIQTAMGWENYHLHQFVKNKTYFSKQMPNDIFWDDSSDTDYGNMKVCDLLTKEKEKVVYEYDFGDGWEHNIVLEKILPGEEEFKRAVCLDGKMHGPPEDCGGIYGYANMLEIIKNPDHEEYGRYVDWLEEEFDQEYFNLEEVNKMLKEKNYGWW